MQELRQIQFRDKGANSFQEVKVHGHAQLLITDIN
jgi:hypothetical protein